MSNYPDVYVPNSVPNGRHPPTSPYQTRTYRAPTVDEALRYTPLTSIVPFSPGMLQLSVHLPTPSHFDWA